MSERRRGPVVLAALLGVGCGPEFNEPVSSDSSGAEGSSSSSATTLETTDTDAGPSSSSGSSGGSGSPSECEGWTPPRDPGWSLQNCRTQPCPEGEVCRFDPGPACGVDPVCVDPTTYQCRCELHDESAFKACPCPGYEGPTNGDGQALIECNTGMSPWPVWAGPCGL